MSGQHYAVVVSGLLWFIEILVCYIKIIVGFGMHERLKENVLETMETDLIIFDLDGTLIDSSEDIALAANRVLADLGHTKMDSDRVKRDWVGSKDTPRKDDARGRAEELSMQG